MQSLNPHSCSLSSWRTSAINETVISFCSFNLPIFRQQTGRRTRRLLVSSRQGRQPKRRNRLREKLLTKKDQLSRVLEVMTPELQPEKAQSRLNGPDGDRIGEIKTRLLDDSLLCEGCRKEDSELWNKLENWVDQYRKDSDVWGLGSAPIFTIYKDGDGNVVRVSLDEKEILRRNQSASMSMKPKVQKEDLNAKVSRAKLIAKEIESGEFMVPENSTIAKIVVDGMSSSSLSSSSYVDRFHLLKPGGKTVTAINPRNFLPLIVSFLLIWVVKKFLFTSGRTEISMEEKEMLRRKLKSRMEMGMAEQGTVEIINDVPELQAGSDKRPSLDRDELMKNIRLKTSSESNVYESRKLVEQVHELEQEEQQIESDSLFLPSTAGDQFPGLQLDEASDNERKVPRDAAHLNHGSSIEKRSTGFKPRVIVSLSEARKYLTQKSLASIGRAEVDFLSHLNLDHAQDREDSENFDRSSLVPSVGCLSPVDDGKPEMANPNSDVESHGNLIGEDRCKTSMDSLEIYDRQKEHQEVCGDLDSSSGSSDPENDDSQAGAQLVQDETSWVEKNFQKFDPIIQKIGTGFQENYLSAREKAKEQQAPLVELSKITLDEVEFEWMNDEDLREIVFKVRDNELAGKDPFHLMGPNEKDAFFSGLERKAEKVSAKMSALHEYLHSKIENIDYGIDGISMHDPPEKIFPRWKGPSLTEDPEFLNKHSSDVTKDLLAPLKSSSPVHNLGKNSSDGASMSPRTIIQSSDGSSRPGKKLGKEQWEHTKKWSREFLQLYNEETDPEIKSIMRDMGKDLDKWITEREIQDVADLMSRIPRRKRKFIEKKLNKLKSQIENFGHQAVFAKYKEYVDDKEEDYLWWLDLKFILCIEMYRVEDDVPKIGFYSLEMASDLDLDPKQYHVIAFEDPGDSKNFCHIMQSHLEMLGNGSAFVVARPPKDAFREAKADGFSITIIRKGEIKLNVDQTLEEVEEEITEIGSKMYHDKIMKDRGIDMGRLMKGVINADKSSKRKSDPLLEGSVGKTPLA